MYAKLTLKNVRATSFLTRGLADICFWIPLQRKQSRKTTKVMIMYHQNTNIDFLTISKIPKGTKLYFTNL